MLIDGINVYTQMYTVYQEDTTDMSLYLIKKKILLLVGVEDVQSQYFFLPSSV